jgi:hypothetical protein
MQQVLKGISGLSEERTDLFLRLFGVLRPPARDRRLQMFLKDILPDLLQPGPMPGTLFAIMDALGSCRLSRSRRSPRSSSGVPSTNLSSTFCGVLEIVFSSRARDILGMASFVTLPQFHVVPGCISVEGIDVMGTTYGEEDYYYPLGTDAVPKLYIRAAPRQPDVPVWMIVHYVTAKPSFVADFCQRHDVAYARGAKVVCQHTKCPGLWLDLTVMVTGVLRTGSLRCPQCGANIGWADIVIQGERPAALRPTRSAREQPTAIAENLEYGQVPVNEESVDEQNMRRQLSIILCSRLKGPPEKQHVPELFDSEFDMTAEGSVDPYREPETTDGFLEEIEATDPY